MSKRYDCSDLTFQLYSVFEIPMLFTNERVDRETIPEGYYMYEIRHDDDCQGIPSEIAKWIFVNFWGTVISYKELDLNETQRNGKKYRLFNSMNEIMYLDHGFDIGEYRDYVELREDQQAVLTDKKRNMAYWDDIDGIICDALKDVAMLSIPELEVGIDNLAEQIMIDITADIREIIISRLEKIGCNFPSIEQEA